MEVPLTRRSRAAPRRHPSALTPFRSTAEGAWRLALFAVALMFPGPQPLSGSRPAAQASGDAQVQASDAADSLRRVSLEEAERLFDRHGLALRLARSELQAATGRARQGAAYPNPSASVLHESLDRGPDDYRETSYSLRQPVEWPGRTLARSRAADRAVEAAGHRFRADSLRSLFRVREAYLRAAEAEARRDVLRRVADVVRRVAEAGRARREEGDISGYELRRLRLERARLEQELAEAVIELASARRTLGTLIAPDDPTPVAPRGLPAGRPPAADSARVLAAAAERPSVRGGAAAVEAAAAEAGAARLSRIPDLALTGGLKDQSDGFDGPVLGVSVSLPLLDRKGGAVQAAEAGAEAARTRLALERRTAVTDALRTLDRYRSLRRRSRLVGERLLRGSEDLLRIARTAYAAGEMSLVELLDGTRAYRDARRTEMELRADLWIAYYDLRRATGGQSPSPRSDATSEQEMER